MAVTDIFHPYKLDVNKFHAAADVKLTDARTSNTEMKKCEHSGCKGKPQEINPSTFLYAIWREIPSLSKSSAESQALRVYQQPESMPLLSLKFKASTDAYIAHCTKTHPWVSFNYGRKSVILNEQMTVPTLLASFATLNLSSYVEVLRFVYRRNMTINFLTWSSWFASMFVEKLYQTNGSSDTNNMKETTCEIKTMRVLK